MALYPVFMAQNDSLIDYVAIAAKVVFVYCKASDFHGSDCPLVALLRSSCRHLLLLQLVRELTDVFQEPVPLQALV